MACNGGKRLASWEPTLFQSLAGFFVACNDTSCRATFRSQGFNPWRVFSWLATVDAAGVTPPAAFQSLAGFFVACNTLLVAQKATSSNQVSIPGGFFRGLQLRFSITKASTPNEFQSLAGFFVACNFRKAESKALMIGMFQSLAGFFVACNANNYVKVNGVAMFQSLAGFFVACNQAPLPRVWYSCVSIPGGFFRGLQHKLSR